MPTAVEDTQPEREQTDESLRAERAKVDQAIGEQVAASDETADAVIARTRARADELVASARARTDRQSAAPVPTPGVERERIREDRSIEKDRIAEDELVREQRIEQTALLEAEREETDKDLSSERARADGALATRDEFLGLVSHDLRSMLSTVLGWAHLIETAVPRPGHDETVLGYARRIQRSGARMDRLIGDLVDVASIEAGKLMVSRELGDPAQVVREALDICGAQAAAGGITLSMEIVPPTPRARFDPARLLQVLTNLLGNALKFTPPQGRISVRLERQGDDLCFAVHDTGAGITSDMLATVFERFVQVNAQDRRGVGLGLYIARCIVEGHGGRIWAESTVGKGSTFSFTLPLGAAAPRS